MNTYIIGIDIGATNTRVAVLNTVGEIIERHRIPSEMAEGRPFFEKVGQLASKLAHKTGAQVVGVGSAGQIHKGTGCYLPGLYPDAPWVGIPLRDIIQGQTGLPVFVDNDCKISAYAELKVGQGQQVSDFICLTLGTGIGGGIIANGQLVHGEHGIAGHLGHISIDPRGPLCPCGNTGCLELYVSGTAVGKRASEAFNRKVDSKEAFLLANAGDSKALEVVHSTGFALGRGLGAMANLLNPQRFILSGSILEWYDLLRPSIEEGFTKSVMSSLKHTPILQSTLGGDGGIIGAALYAWDQIKR